MLQFFKKNGEIISKEYFYLQKTLEKSSSRRRRDNQHFYPRKLFEKKYPFGLIILKSYSGAEAVSTFIEHNCIQTSEPIDLIFMDCIMPDCDGYEASQKIITISQIQAIESPVIVACSAFEGIEEEEKCVKVGMRFFLRKPVAEEDIRKLFNNEFKTLSK